VEIYDPKDGEWLAGPLMTRNRVFGNLLVANSNLYAVGGDMDNAGNLITRTIEKYNDDLNIWEFVTTFKDERRGFSTCAVNHKIYVFGGSFSNGEVYNDTWDVFDAILNIWESSLTNKYNSMPTIDDWGQAVTLPSTTNITW
jgi:N-acetylneuraminic acid mutarotase